MAGARVKAGPLGRPVFRRSGFGLRPVRLSFCEHPLHLHRKIGLGAIEFVIKPRVPPAQKPDPGGDGGAAGNKQCEPEDHQPEDHQDETRGDRQPHRGETRDHANRTSGFRNEITQARAIPAAHPSCVVKLRDSSRAPTWFECVRDATFRGSRRCLGENRLRSVHEQRAQLVPEGSAENEQSDQQNEIAA